MPNEGARLAELASDVPDEWAIVEIGTHTGLSTCYMAHGSRGAHVTAVDPWANPRPETLDDPFELLTGDAVYERFVENVTEERLWHRITPLRTTSTIVAQVWVQPVGLLFIDAIHEYEAVRTDYLHWQRHIPVGGWLAFHDYTTIEEHAYYGVYLAIDATIPKEEWTPPVIVGNMWTAKRLLTAG